MRENGMAPSENDMAPDETKPRGPWSRLSKKVKAAVGMGALLAAGELHKNKDKIVTAVNESQAKYEMQKQREEKEMQHAKGEIIEIIHKASGGNLSPGPGTFNGFDVIYPEKRILKIKIGNQLGKVELSVGQGNHYKKGQQVDVLYSVGPADLSDGTNLKIKLLPASEQGK